MPHQSFGTVRVGPEREPITFDFGLYSEETFTVSPEPSLGDTFDLSDAPEASPETMLECARALAKFIRRMLMPEDRQRFDLALYRIPASQCHIIVEAGTYIVEQMTGFPTTPPASSLVGRPSDGPTSKPRSGGKKVSKA